ncbi:redoxin domain-containing protein [Nitratidesulfovibrio sp. SRB-5]|uniref:redoxin domain-containing protein n=1 Tax=Nitratidesulfovibrio sp. SRB-5 TaxID=2872636 RepID=UPI001024FACC|nr:redoxin domain-containing protein [Nitratidesulfovibrio sp. SRB-5]MBZ2172036.1 redoxin domain-containing protein [Nitratidesulfovibrio sp. SRB-5]RXF77547.1 redoxin domain-containing protein [Desulfovibrio sp. DS-1]
MPRTTASCTGNPPPGRTVPAGRTGRPGRPGRPDRPDRTTQTSSAPGTPYWLTGRTGLLLAAAILALALLGVLAVAVPLQAAGLQDLIYPDAPRKPVDSVLKVAVGDTAPDFVLPALPGPYTSTSGTDTGTIRLSDFRGKRAVVLSFVPAAFTPVCSGQWPGYNIAREEFERRGAVLLGITTDNLPSLYAWTREMVERTPGNGNDEGHGAGQSSPPPRKGQTAVPRQGEVGGAVGGVWFPVLSDFWPHGAVAASYGLLRGDGMAERALVIIDRQGIIRHIHVSDVNKRPPLDIILRALDALPSP